jgi:hypothetical protein
MKEGAMRFLIHVRSRPPGVTGVQMTPQQGAELLQATINALEERKRLGEIEFSLSAPNNTAGSWALVNVPSTEVLAERIATFPGAELFDWEVYPVADTVEVLKGTLQRALLGVS